MALTAATVATWSARHSGVQAAVAALYATGPSGPASGRGSGVTSPGGESRRAASAAATSRPARSSTSPRISATPTCSSPMSRSRNRRDRSATF